MRQQTDGYAVVFLETGETNRFTLSDNKPTADVEAVIDWCDTRLARDEVGHIYLPYRSVEGTTPVPVDTAITKTPECKLTIHGGRFRNDIDSSAVTTGNTPGVFQIGNEDPVASYDLTADVNEREKSVFVSTDDAANFAPGDHVVIESSTLTLSGGNYGESSQVVSVDEGTGEIVLEHGLNEDHNTADGAQIHRWDYCSVSFRDTEITASLSRTDAEEQLVGIKQFHNNDVLHENVRVKNQVIAGMWLEGNWNAIVRNYDSDNNSNSANNGYGLVFAGAANRNVVESINGKRSRHVIAGFRGGGDNYGCPEYTIRSSTFGGGRDDNHCIDAHDDVYRMTVQDVDIYGETPYADSGQAITTGAYHNHIGNLYVQSMTEAINARGEGNTGGTLVAHNVTTDRCRRGLMLFGGARKFDSVVIKDMTVLNTDQKGIWIQESQGYVEIKNLTVRSEGGEHGIYFASQNDAGTDVGCDRLVVDGVSIDGTVSNDVVRLAEVDEGIIQNVHGSSDGNGVVLTDTTNVRVTGCTLEGTGSGTGLLENTDGGSGSSSNTSDSNVVSGYSDNTGLTGSTTV
jgi:hypothetical protein